MIKKIISLLLIITFLFFNIAAVKRPVSFLQQDDKWGHEPYTITGNPVQTIENGGCGPTAMAMLLNYYIDDSITPIQTAIFSMSNGHQTVSSGTSWGFFKDMANEYNLEFKQTSSPLEAKQWMEEKEDPLMICSMGPGLWTVWGHFILVWNVEGDIVYINDPYSLDENKSVNSYNYMTSQCRQYFCFNQKIKYDESVFKSSSVFYCFLDIKPFTVKIAE